MRRIAFFEDNQTANFSPIALLRPVFELICGAFSIRERLVPSNSDVEWGAFLRAELVNVYQEQHAECHINDSAWMAVHPTLLVNGRWLGAVDEIETIEPGTAGWVGDEVAWVMTGLGDSLVHGDDSFSQMVKNIAREKKPVPATGKMLHYPWDFIANNAEQLERDFEQRAKGNSQKLASNVGLVGPAERVFVDSTAEIDPFVVLDARHGSIWIDAKAKIQAFTRIEGPAYIGRESQTFRANIREGTTIGPVCRIGGEIEESIIHGYVNKYHDGFLGHGYICPWVNLGALTTNSDLKNDYSNVSVPLAGESIKTDSNKVGCFIGDHTKTAVGSLLNTGTSIGAGCLILPGGELLPKHVPSFSRIWHGRLESLPDETTLVLQTARHAMGRRDQEMTPAMERLIQSIYEATQAERERALKRQADQQTKS